MWWDCIALLFSEEGVVDVVGGGVGEEEVGRVRRGWDGDVSVCLLDHLVGGGGILFVKSVEFGPRGGGEGWGGH